MPRNPDNTFYYTNSVEPATGEKITASWINGRFNDIAGALASSLNRTGTVASENTLNWVFDNVHGIIDLPYDNNSLLTGNNIINPIQIIPVIDTSRQDITFTNSDANTIILKADNSTVISTVTVSFDDAILGNSIYVLITNNCSTPILVINGINVTPVNLLNNCAVFFQKIGNVWKIINTANLDLDTSNAISKLNITLDNKNISYIGNLNNFTTTNQMLYQQDGLLHINNSNTTLTGTFNPGDIVAQVSCPTYQVLTGRGNSVVIKFTTNNNGRNDTFNYFSDFVLNKLPGYNRPANLYLGTYFCDINQPRVVDRYAYSPFPDEQPDYYTVYYAISAAVNPTYLITNKVDNYTYNIDTKLNQISSSRQFFYNQASYTSSNEPRVTGKTIPNVNYPLAKFGTSFDINLTDEIHFKLQDLSIFLNGLAINAMTNNTQTTSQVICNPILTIVDNNYNPLNINTTSIINLCSLNTIASDFASNLDYNSQDGTTLFNANNLTYQTTGGMVIGFNNHQRVQDFTAIGNFASPLNLWSMPSSSLSNGYVKFIRITGNLYQVIGNITSKLNNSSGTPYGQNYNKNTYLNINIFGTADLNGAYKAILMANNMPAVQNAGVKIPGNSVFNISRNEERPVNISDLGTTNTTKTSTITFAIDKTSLTNTNGAGCFGSGTINTNFVNNNA